MIKGSSWVGKTVAWSMLLCSFLLSAQNIKKDYWISYIDSLSGRELYGYKDLVGNVKIEAQYSLISTDTLYTVALVATPKQGWVMINRQNKVILKPFIYDNGPDYIAEGLFRYVEKGKMGFANKEGKKVIPAQFDFVSYFSDGLAAFSVGGKKVMDKYGEQWSWLGGKWGYVNKEGKIVIHPQFDFAYDFVSGEAGARLKDGRMVRINKEGKIVK